MNLAILSHFIEKKILRRERSLPKETLQGSGWRGRGPRVPRVSVSPWGLAVARFSSHDLEWPCDGFPPPHTHTPSRELLRTHRESSVGQNVSIRYWNNTTLELLYYTVSTNGIITNQSLIWEFQRVQRGQMFNWNGIFKLNCWRTTSILLKY